MTPKLHGRVLVVGSLNLDFIIDSPIPKPGQTILGKKFLKRAGGKGANQAVAASKITHQVWMSGGVGSDDEGAELIAALNTYGVNTEHVKKVHNQTGVAFVTVDTTGENAITVISGANHSLVSDHIHDAIKIIQPDVLVMQAENNLDVVAELLSDENISARKIFNLAPYQSLNKQILTMCDPLVVNEHEACELLGHGLDEDFHKAGNELLNISKSAILTLGARGAIVCENNVVKHFPARTVDVVRDTTGAGDGFVGSLAAYIASGYSLEDATLRAIDFAGLAVSRTGGMSSYPEITELVTR